MRPLALAVLALATQGCATTLSTLQTADVADVGQVQAAVGYGFYANLGPVVTVVDQGIKQGQAIDEANRTGQPYTISEEAQQELLTAAIAIAAMPPGSTWEVSARTGVWRDRMDVGLRYSVNAVRADTKYQFLRHDAEPQHEGDALARRRLEMAVGAGVSYYLFPDNPLLDALEYVSLGDFSRWDFEAPLIASVDLGDVLKLYWGFRYVYSVTRMDPKLVNYSQQATLVTGVDVGIPEKVEAHYIGGTAGLALGYRWVHAMVELNGGYTHCEPLLFGRYRRLGGPTVYPALGLGVKIP